MENRSKFAYERNHLQIHVDYENLEVQGVKRNPVRYLSQQKWHITDPKQKRPTQDIEAPYIKREVEQLRPELYRKQIH